MMSDANAACADMILVDAITDLALRSGLAEAEIREQIIESGAYDALYDQETGLWASGPDAFIDFFEQMQRSRALRR